jgi:NAD(P)-dependent dehydrogenase (short-subunit alcohol dehydrogenase family)
MEDTFRNVSGKVAVVTGAARGIGFGCAEAMAAQGVHVVLADRSPEVREAWERIHRQSPGVRGYARIVDVSREEEVRGLIEEAAEQFGQIDILCNNAGINCGEKPVTEVTEEEIDRHLNVNFKGMVWGCKYGGRQMMKQHSGTIVNTGSWYGKVGHANSALYGASKGAVHTLTQAFAMEMAPYGVTVNAICPALADSEMHWAYLRKESAETGVPFETLRERELGPIPLKRLGTGADLAGAVLFLATRAGSYVTGQLINVNGGVDFT